MSPAIPQQGVQNVRRGMRTAFLGKIVGLEHIQGGPGEGFSAPGAGIREEVRCPLGKRERRLAEVLEESKEVGQRGVLFLGRVQPP